ncbi:hypothetical protein [Hydrogenophaga sp. PAMC20947]|uniref:hypothetical protein n=1 Tax=Hydrogenophaga sp. PAMC20947 TaxID=2565558 RepID=UPI00109E0CCD|nr:hypothetical protein [Hydrogenophaga sp. PAMC20947]QCB45131.1 hypothetical protein E5678_03250 [Hydrogenophaga sp. PAMC20947]
MNNHQPGFVTVDMRDLKAALVARAQAQRVSVSVLVRRAVAREFGLEESFSPQALEAARDSAPADAIVKLSIRVTTAEAERLAAGARLAGLSRGAYLAGLIAGIPALTSGVSRPEQLATLTASNAELSTLSRNIHHLTHLLRRGDVVPALAYRDMLNTLDGDVRRHLVLAAGVLADLRPRSHQARPAQRRNH